MRVGFVNAALRMVGPLALVGAIVAACGAQAGGPQASAAPVPLRLGYFPNVTHSAAVAGVAKGIFAEKLGSNVTLEPKTFNAGPEAVEAIFAGGLDATFIGPNPAINAFIKSNGQAIRIISGATSGGAFFVVRDGIDNAEDLRGTKIASPQLGNTQDVALRAWLADNGLTADAQGGGDVSILPQSNSQTLETFVAGGIDGAWVPEPWATRMINEGGGHVLVDERDLWPNGQYVTTHLIVRTEFLNQHPDVVKRLIQGQLAATDYVNNSPAEAQAAVAAQINQITGTTTSPSVLASAWANLTFTVDPISSSLQKSAADAAGLGFLDSANLAGIYDLTLLNQVLADAGRPQIALP
jgi:NitT/TauT family transport system substrate-binding protein